jgi:apolipoprotein N-acyltransferase
LRAFPADAYTQTVRGISTRQWLLAILSGILQVLIFPSPSLYLLSWIAIAPLILAVVHPLIRGMEWLDSSGVSLSATTPAQGFLLGYINGIIVFAGSCYWVYHVMHLYGGLTAPVAAGVQALFCLYLGLYNGAFGLLLALAARRQTDGLRRALLVSPFLWVAMELARARITGFPWDLLGTAQVDNIPLSSLGTLTGVYGVSFIIALVNAGMVAAWLSPPLRRRRLVPIIVAVAAMLQLGALVHPKPLPAPERANLVQQNIPLDFDWTPARLSETTSQLVQLSTLPPPPGPPSARGLRLIIWPESPAPFYDNDLAFRQVLSSLARGQQAYVVAGVVGTLKSVGGKPNTPPDLANRAVMVAPSGEWAARYDKVHLVPFGEYVPFKSLFGFADKLTRDVGNFRPGKQRTVFHSGGNDLGTFICYEEIFPDEVREFAARGAQVFINISNDGWYGEHGAPGQLLNMARMRSVENRRWMLRATNTGITASIDPYGRVVAQAPRNQRVSLEAPYDFARGDTLYTRRGDWFAWTCAIISLLGIFVRFSFRAMKLSS